MENLSNLISKQVISVEEGVCVGYVLNAVIDSKTLKLGGFLVVDEESEKVNFLDYKNILAVNDFIMIKNSDMLSFGDNIDSNSPVGKLVLTEIGEIVGRVIDLEIDDRNILKLITDKCEINSKIIFNFETNYLFINLKRKKRKNKIQFPKIIDELDNKVIIEGKKEEKIKNNLTEKRATKKTYQIPFKAGVSTIGLIGKRAVMDIFGKNNEIIARKNEIITQKIINKAKKHGRENYLIFNCR